MAPPVALINSFPVLGSLSTTLHVLSMGVLGLAFLAAAARLLVRWRRQAVITEHGRRRGLGDKSAAFLGTLFAGEGLDAAETMLAAPDLLRARLARELRRRHREESANAYAACAAHLLEELNSIPPAFPGAPGPFQQLALQDAADPKSEVVTAWVLAVDERNVTLISRHDCEWPMRRELLATPPDGHGEPFRASLLLRPVPPRHEWVLTHDLVDVITNRRAAVRVPCCLHTHVLPDSGDTVLLRERLADQEAVPADELRRLHGWAQRHVATVVDVSSDGCRLELEHEVALRDRFHVMFTGPGDRLAGLPLAEVVGLQRSAGGRVAAGVRFIGMRLKERTRLAEYVRELAAGQGGAVASAVRALDAEAAELARVAERARAGAADGPARTMIDVPETVGNEDDDDHDQARPSEAGREARGASSAADDTGDPDDPDDPDATDGSDDESEGATLIVTDSLSASDLAAIEALKPLEPPPEARAREPAEAKSSPLDFPFDYQPRFVSPFGKPSTASEPPAAARSEPPAAERAEPAPPAPVDARPAEHLDDHVEEGGFDVEAGDEGEDPR